MSTPTSEKESEEKEKEWRRKVRDYIFWEEPQPPIAEGVGRPSGLQPKIRNKIISVLSNGPKKFTELLRETKIQRNVLSKHLDALEKENIVRRRILPVKGHYVEYSLVGPPYTIAEYMLPLHRGRAIYDFIPYERYMVWTTEERKSYDIRSEEIHKMMNIINYKEIFDRVTTIIPDVETIDPETGEKCYVMSGQVETVIEEALQYYKRRIKNYKKSIEKIEAKTPEERIRMQVHEESLPWKLFLDDLRAENFCMECFKRGEYSIMLTDSECSEKVCPKCGLTAQLEVFEEGKTERVSPGEYIKKSDGSVQMLKREVDTYLSKMSKEQEEKDESNVIKMLDEVCSLELKNAAGSLAIIQAMVDLGNEWHHQVKVLARAEHYAVLAGLYARQLFRRYPEIFEAEGQFNLRINPRMFPYVKKHIALRLKEILKKYDDSNVRKSLERLKQMDYIKHQILE
jgi:DNA-binding transcriptional ArsR family regulator